MDYGKAIRALLVSAKFFFQTMRANGPLSRVLHGELYHHAGATEISFGLVCTIA